MQYSKNQKIGTITGCYEVIHNSKPTSVNLILDTTVDRLRKRLSNLMKKEIIKIKPDSGMLSWSTKLGKFCISKEYEYEDNSEPYKSKYKFLYHYVELDRRKHGGEVETKKYLIKKIVNDECEDLKECFSCNSKMVESYKIKQWGEMVEVCKKCKDFDNKLNKIANKLDKEKKQKSKRKLQIE